MINDSLGHQAGDQVLIGVAQRLLDIVSAEAGGSEFTVARISGDEFALLLEDTPAEPSVAAAARIGALLIGDMERPFLVGGREVFTSVSIGVAHDTGEYENPGEIQRDADTAMYRAKRSENRVARSSMPKCAPRPSCAWNSIRICAKLLSAMSLRSITSRCSQFPEKNWKGSKLWSAGPTRNAV